MVRLLLLIAAPLIAAPLIAAPLIAASAFAGAPVLLEYSYGTLHGRSRLTVFADGTVDAVESTCCPRMERDGNLSPLSSEDLKVLQVAVNLAVDGPWDTFGLPRSLEMPLGGFYAYWQGRSVVIRRIQNLTSGPRDLQNRSSAAAYLEQWIRARVERRMPPLR